MHWASIPILNWYFLDPILSRWIYFCTIIAMLKSVWKTQNNALYISMKKKHFIFPFVVVVGGYNVCVCDFCGVFRCVGLTAKQKMIDWFFQIKVSESCLKSIIIIICLYRAFSVPACIFAIYSMCVFGFGFGLGFDTIRRDVMVAFARTYNNEKRPTQ